MEFHLLITFFFPSSMQTLSPVRACVTTRQERVYQNSIHLVVSHEYIIGTAPLSDIHGSQRLVQVNNPCDNHIHSSAGSALRTHRPHALALTHVRAGEKGSALNSTMKHFLNYSMRVTYTYIHTLRHHFRSLCSPFHLVPWQIPLLQSMEKMTHVYILLSEMVRSSYS